MFSKRKTFKVKSRHSFTQLLHLAGKVKWAMEGTNKTRAVKMLYFLSQYNTDISALISQYQC